MAKKTVKTQDLVPVKNIKNGVIETISGKYLKVVEVTPINFHLRSEKEKNAIIYSFASYLKVAPIKIHFKVFSRPADISGHVESIIKEMKDEKDPGCKELQEDYLQLLCNVGGQQGVTRQFFFIFEYHTIGIRVDTYEQIVQSLNAAVSTFKNLMRHCGNKVIEHDDPNGTGEDFWLTNLLYEIYNRTAEASLNDRMLEMVSSATKAGKTAEDVSVADLVAPNYIHFDKKYMVANDLYYTFLYVPGAKYRTMVQAGWLAGLVNAGEGIDTDLYLFKQNKEKIRNKLGRNIRLNRAKIKDTSDTNRDFDDLSNAIESGYFIKEGLGNNEDCYFMSLMITITGRSIDELKDKMSYVKELLMSQDMDIEEYSYRMPEAFNMSLPLMEVNKEMFEKSKRNVLTFGAASTYIFTSFEISDSNGILLGVNNQNSTMCIIDLYNSAKYKNANVAILGTSGSGKTFTMQTMALRLRMKDIQTFIIAPLKGHEFKRACQSIGGEYIKISPGSANSINILEIRPLDKSAERLLDGEDEQIQDSILSKKIQNVHAFFSLIIPDMTYEEVQLLDNALLAAYAEKGITHDNESLVDPHKKPINGLPQYKDMPILEDVYNVLKREERTMRLANILDRYVHGSAASFNRPTNVDLNNKYVVVDISEFTEDLQPVGMFVALDYIYDKVKEDRTKKKAVFIDETWKLIGAKSNALAANFVLEIFKIIRGYGGAAIAATQDINDFFALDDGKYGRGIIANSKTKIILQLEANEAETVRDVFDLTETEALSISRFERGNGLIITNSNNVPVRFVASLKEEELITTDRARLEEIANQRKQ